MRSVLMLAIAAVLGFGLHIGPASAADDKHDHTTHKADAGHKAEDGHGGESPSSGGPVIFPTSADTTLWSLAVFLITLFLLTKYAWTPAVQGLHDREHKIQSALDEAVKAREQAEQMRLEFDKQRAQANDEIRAMMDTARHDAEKLATEFLDKGKAEIQADRDRLRREMDTARDQTLETLYQQSVELATLISTKAIGQNLPAEAHRSLVNEALQEIQTQHANSPTGQTILGSKL